MLGFWLVLLAALLLVVTTWMWRGNSPAEARLKVLGFKRQPEGTWQRTHENVTLRSQVQNGKTRIEADLPVSPLPYRAIVRALGRGDVLASLHELNAQAEKSIVYFELSDKSRVLEWSQTLRQMEQLVQSLRHLNLGEGAVLWFLERQRLEEHLDESEESIFKRILEAFPDAPEVFQLVRIELERPGNPEVKRLAQAKLGQVLKANNEA